MDFLRVGNMEVGERAGMNADVECVERLCREEEECE